MGWGRASAAIVLVFASLQYCASQDVPPPACCAACAGAGGYCPVSGLACCCADVVVYLYSAIETCRAPLTCDATQLCSPPPPQDTAPSPPPKAAYTYSNSPPPPSPPEAVPVQPKLPAPKAVPKPHHQPHPNPHPKPHPKPHHRPTPRPVPRPTRPASGCGSTTELQALPLPTKLRRSTGSCILPESRQRLAFDLRAHDSSAVLSVVTSSLQLTGFGAVTASAHFSYSRITGTLSVTFSSASVGGRKATFLQGTGLRLAGRLSGSFHGKKRCFVAHPQICK